MHPAGRLAYQPACELSSKDWIVVDVVSTSNAAQDVEKSEDGNADRPNATGNL